MCIDKPKSQLEGEIDCFWIRIKVILKIEEKRVLYAELLIIFIAEKVPTTKLVFTLHKKLFLIVTTI